LGLSIDTMQHDGTCSCLGSMRAHLQHPSGQECTTGCMHGSALDVWSACIRVHESEEKSS